MTFLAFIRPLYLKPLDVIIIIITSLFQIQAASINIMNQGHSKQHTKKNNNKK